MHFRRSLVVGLLAAAAFNAWAQKPASLAQDLMPLDQIQSRHFQALDLQRLAEEDAIAEAMGMPQRFAIKHPAGITPENMGTWEQRGELSIWRYRVFAEQAASFNFGFTRFHLPEGASLFVSSADGKHVAGPYTAAKNAPHGQLWTPAIPSSDVVIELNVPTTARYRVQLELGSINQGYRGFGGDSGDYQQPAQLGGKGQACLSEDGTRSAACNTDVACLEDDDPWNEPRRSVAALQIGGALNCTGSLLNNTGNDGRMLVATASHCMDPGDAPTLVAIWNYEWPSCRRPGAAGGTSTSPPDMSVSSTGATFLARTRNPFTSSGGDCNPAQPGECSDFTLVEFDDAPDPAWNLHWAGWDRSNADHPCSNPADPSSTDGLCASIHHPSVDEKRITFVADPLVTANISSAQGVHWFARWDQTPTELPKFPAGGTLPPSVTERGSSGSPLYNADQRFVGVLSGGASFCGASPGQLNDQYGKLAHAWEGLGTPATRMHDYLDPLGTGVMTLDGRDGEVGEQANLALALAAAPDPVVNGDNATITATVDNAGPDAATGVTVTLTLPDALAYQSASPADWTCGEASGLVTCELAGDIAAGESAAALDLVVQADADQNGPVTAEGEVAGSEFDPINTDNAASVELTITGVVTDLIFADGFEQAAVCEPLQLLADPGFEETTGNAGQNEFWTGVDSNDPGGGTPFYSQAARTGSFGAWIGGWSVASAQSWSQRVTIPSGSPRFLNFWRQVSVMPASGSGELKVFVDDEEVFSFTGNSVDGGFVGVSVDVSEFTDGGEHEIVFEGSDPGGGNLFVDDVTLDCESPKASQTVSVRTDPGSAPSKHDR